jgi:cobalt-zinc-cadmium efflux system protein
VSENRHNHTISGHIHDQANVSGKRIFWVVLLNATITVAELVGGLLSGSLALLSDATHNLSDTVAIALSYFANRISRKPKDARKTFGYKRAEILAAFVNSSVLLVISLFLIVEAVKRFRNPETIDGVLMITVAVMGLLANLMSVFLLHRDSHDNLNIRASYLHLISDTVSSIGVIAGGIIINVWGIFWVDPLVTILIALYIISKAWVVVIKTVDILMQSAADLDYEVIKKDIEKMTGVKNIHHVHSWMSNENTIYFEAHIDMVDMQLCEAENIYDQIEHYLKEEHGVSHVTLQAEVNKCQDKAIFKL